MLVAALTAAAGAAPSGSRAALRAFGNDRPTALAVASALLAQPLPAQLTRVRCDRAGEHRVCGLVVSGVKFHHPLDRTAFLAEVRDLIRGAFAAAPLEEVDLWVTVPLDAGRGAVVSGDYAQPAAATVFTVTVPRAQLAGLDARLQSGRDIAWDPQFAAELAKGAAR